VFIGDEREEFSVPALPWKPCETVELNSECTVMGSRLPLKSYLRIPGFLAATLRIRRQLARAPGLVGYSLNAQLFRKTFWTVSAWSSRQSLEQFARTDPHHGDTNKIRPAMLPSTFVFWTTRADSLPIGWDEVRRRIDEERSKTASA
jgi:hypothetical protein